jgi:serine/threonine-protein kinase
MMSPLESMDTAPVDPREFETQLDRVLSSATFRRAERSTALLGYLVRHGLDGPADRLKEYTIGAEGLGRGASFDPRTDPIVRAEASRLRARLEQYYKTEGRSDAIVITLPKGSYVPRFSHRAEPGQPADPVPAPRFLSSRSTVALVVLAALGLGFGLGRALETPGSTQAVQPAGARLEVELAKDGHLGAEVGPSIVLARNGERVVFASRDARGISRLYTRLLSEDQPIQLAGTDAARDPFISADGQWVGFWSDGSLRKVSTRGGSPVVLCEMPGSSGASWGTEDIIVGLSPSRKLWRLRQHSAAREPILDLTAESASPVWPQVLPGDDSVLYTVIPAAGADGATIEVVSLRTGKRTIVQRNGTFGRYADGHLTYVNQGTLYAVKFDPGRVAVEGDAVPLVENVSYSRAFGYAEMDVSETGMLIYRRGAESGPFVAAQRDRSGGAVAPLVATPGRYSWPRATPDGRLALIATDRGTTAIRIYETRTGEVRKLASPTGEYRGLMWGPNGKSLLLAGMNGMTWIDLDRTTRPRSLTISRSLQVPWSIAPDGSRLAYYEMDQNTGLDLWTVPLTSAGTEIQAGTPERFFGTSAMESYPAFSPDGRWIAYASNESGPYEVYVRRFPDDGTGAVQVSRGGGSVPHWSRQREEIVYRTEDNRLMITSYRIEGHRFIAESHQAWPSEPLADTGVLPNFDLTPDGQHVVALMPASPISDRQAANHATVVMKVFEGMRQRNSLR